MPIKVSKFSSKKSNFHQKIPKKPKKHEKNSPVLSFRKPRWGAKVARRGPQQGPQNPPQRGGKLRLKMAIFRLE